MTTNAPVTTDGQDINYSLTRLENRALKAERRVEELEKRPASPEQHLLIGLEGQLTVRTGPIEGVDLIIPVHVPPPSPTECYQPHAGYVASRRFVRSPVIPGPKFYAGVWIEQYR